MSAHSLDSRTYAYGSLRVAVTCADRSFFIWLEEFLAPSFAPAAYRQADWSLEVLHDPDRYEATLATGPARAGKQIACFTHDGHFKSHPLWRTNETGVTFWIDTHRCFATVNHPQRRIELLHGQPKARPRLAAMRILRELATIDRLSRGHLHLHASAYVAADGAARLMTGPKRSGKSSSLIHALHAPASRYLTNDRLYLHREGGRWMATGMPTIVSVRPKSFEFFPRLARGYLHHGFRPGFTLAESPTAPRWRPVELNEKASLSPAQFCRLLDTFPAGPAPLAAIFFPEITTEVERSRLTPLPRAKAASRIEANVFHAGAGRQIPAAFENGRPYILPDRDERLEICHALAAEVECFRLELGPAAYHEPPHNLPQRRAA